MLFRYFSAKYNYEEAYPFDITQMTDDVSFGRRVPSLHGISIYTVCELFYQFGFYPQFYHREIYDDELFERLLYVFIESGLPVVAQVPKHAMVLYGHKSDYTQALDPSDEPVFSDQYMEALIGTDDNYLPYSTFPRDAGGEDLSSEYSISSVKSFVVPLAEKMHLSAESFLRITEGWLTDEVVGYGALSAGNDAGNLVLRPFLTGSSSFKEQCRRRNMPAGVKDLYLELPMPRFIWVCELSTPEEYARGNVLGEVIVDSTSSDRDEFAPIVVHYPHCYILNDRHPTADTGERLQSERVDEQVYSVYDDNLEPVNEGS